MTYHAFPSPCPYLDMKEKKNAYLKHLKALQSPRKVIDNTQPETPSRLVTRKNRYIEMQRRMVKTGDENIRLISNYNQQRDNKAKCNRIYSNTPPACKNKAISRSPSTKNISPKNITPTRNANTPQKKKQRSDQKELPHDDWISNVATELANLPSIDFISKKHPSDKLRKEDLPHIVSTPKKEENSQNIDNTLNIEPNLNRSTENTTLGDAGFQARLESMVNDINGIID